MNRVERFTGHDDKRKQNVGFALQSIQRRLASSPAAIHESLRRRRERLENRLAEERLLARGAQAQLSPEDSGALSAEELEDLEDAPEAEVEATEERILDRATAARTIRVQRPVHGGAVLHRGQRPVAWPGRHHADQE